MDCWEWREDWSCNLRDLIWSCAKKKVRAELMIMPMRSPRRKSMIFIRVLYNIEKNKRIKDERIQQI